MTNSIYRVKPIKADGQKRIVVIPGSKSDTNRALVIASLVNGKTTLTGISESDDSKLLVQALQQLGIEFEYLSKDSIQVYGQGGQFKPFYGQINCGIAGTTSRFLAAVCSLVPGNFVLTGEKKMLERPMKDLFDALKTLGVEFEYLGKEGCLPVRFNNQKPLSKIQKTNQISIRGDVSSQFFTALLLISPILQNGLEISVVGKQVSKSYIDMTQSILSDFGVEMINQNYTKYTVKPNQSYTSQKYQIEGDASGCSYFWSIAAITGQEIEVTNINPNTVQGDVGFVDILEKMGCKVAKDFSKKSITVCGPKALSDLRSVEVNMENMPDTAQSLAIVAAFAKGTTKITGLSTLKDKETNRLEATKTELAKMGIIVETGNDWMAIVGGEPKPAEIATYNDHRMAMSFAVAGTKIDGVIIQNPEVVSKSFPEFWSKIESL